MAKAMTAGHKQNLQAQVCIWPKNEVIAALQLLVEQPFFRFVATASGAALAKIFAWPAHHLTLEADSHGLIAHDVTWFDTTYSICLFLLVW